VKTLAARAELRDDMYSGLLSTGGNLFVGRETERVRDGTGVLDLLDAD
jgi:hypothetical protein